MKNVRFAWIAALLVGIPFAAAVAFNQTGRMPKWLWQINVAPLPFVLSDDSYMRMEQAILSFDDGTQAELDHKAILRNFISSRWDWVVFSHLIRGSGRIPRGYSRSILYRLFCNSSKDTKKVSRVGFTVMSPQSEVIMEEQLQCE